MFAMMTHIMIIYVVNTILHLIHIIMIDTMYLHMMLFVGNLLSRATVAPLGCLYIIGIPFAATLANLATINRLLLIGDVSAGVLFIRIGQAVEMTAMRTPLVWYGFRQM